MRALPFNRSRGFTLIELTVGIVVAGIVAGFIGMFVATPVQGYIAQSRRAELSASAESALRWMNNDIERSLPNSVRTGTLGTVRVLEMVEVAAAVDYRESWPDAGGNPLQIGAVDTSFGVLSGVTLPTNCAGMRVVVDNRRTPANRTVYGNANIITPTTTAVSCAGNTVTMAPGFRFTLYADRSTNQRAYLITGMRRYECDLSTGVLRRFDSTIPLTASIVANGSASTTIARDVTACTFSAITGGRDNGGVAIIDLTVSRVTGTATDRFRMIRQVRVENAS